MSRCNCRQLNPYVTSWLTFDRVDHVTNLLSVGCRYKALQVHRDDVIENSTAAVCIQFTKDIIKQDHRALVAVLLENLRFGDLEGDEERLVLPL